jgi:ABC-type molybdate transport system permease subunit
MKMEQAEMSKIVYGVIYAASSSLLGYFLGYIARKSVVLSFGDFKRLLSFLLIAPILLVPFVPSPLRYILFGLSGLFASLRNSEKSSNGSVR